MAKILLVDDDKNVRMLYQLELEDDGYEVIASGTGAGLLNLIESERPDLVILDVRLAGFDGLELLRKARRLFRDLPVIICSAASLSQHDAESTSPDFCVRKSSNLTELKKTVSTALAVSKRTSNQGPLQMVI
jgi:CheY-like chemotaxis protein